MKYIVITVSDTSSFDAKKDLSGAAIINFMGKGLGNDKRGVY